MEIDNGFTLAEYIADLGKTFSNEQKNLLLEIYNEMKVNGATREQLAPLGELIFIDWNYVLTINDVERATKLSIKHKW